MFNNVRHIFWMFLEVQSSLIALFISFLFCFLIVPPINDIAIKYKIVDNPEERKQHIYPKVRLGGMAIFIAFYLTIFITYLLDTNFNYQINQNRETVTAFLCCTSLYFIIGLLDDLFKISFLIRLVFQFIAAIPLWINNVAIDKIDVSLFGYDINISLNNYLSFFITLIWIVAIINSINWLDGLDGLSAGFISIISLPFIALSISNNNYYLIVIIFSMIGSCLAFLRYNFYPSRILMGDGGSNLLGAFLAFLSIASLKSTNEFIDIKSSILLLSIPLFDMIFVILNRIINKKSPFLPDNNHLHHRIMKSGISHQNTVFFLYLASIFISTISLILA